MSDAKLALQLYKALIREGKKFPEQKRAQYICDLTRKEFRKHRFESDENQRKSLLVYAMDQLENIRHLEEVFEKGEEAHHIGIHTGIVRVLGQQSFMKRPRQKEDSTTKLNK
ncbi:hypothetical protein Gasu2_52750 [Galdieria sulphuraria]|nr:hypothetical protein Gasu2_52750 [Galdieria sulphuraria]